MAKLYSTLFTLVLLTLSLTSSILGQGSGGVSGRVTDSLTGNALPGASVTIEGTSLTAETDRTGSFSIVRVPGGNQKLVISYLGFAAKTVDVNIDSSGKIANVDIKLESGIQESVTVEAPLLEGQARALNQQKESINIQSIVSADQIGRFPDPNSAEAAQRIPGITIERDQGEGRYVQVRGTEARLNSMQINGERIPSPEGDVRAVALDVVPADLLDSIEVSKALTADMDGDSIGGTVNLITKGAPEKTRVSLTFGLGYNKLSKDYIQTTNGTFGRRFFDRKLGILLSGSFFNTDRGSESIEPNYNNGALNELDVRDYRVNRERWGFNPYIDYRFSNTSEIYVRGIYNRFDDDEFRRRVRYQVGNSRIERQLRDRNEIQTISQVAFGGKHLLPGFLNVDYRISYGYAEEDEPKNAQTTFRQTGVTFAPNVTPTTIDPDNIQANPQNENIAASRLQSFVYGDNFTSERSFTSLVNFGIPLPTSDNFAGVFKFGVKNRFNKKRRDNIEDAYALPSASRPFLNTVLDTRYTKTALRDGLYRTGSAFVEPEFGLSILSNPSATRTRNLEVDAENYRTSENIFAGYGLASLNFGERFQLTPGVRFERTDTVYTGFEVLFNSSGNYLSTRQITGDNNYTQILPSVHAKYRITERANFRAAYSRSLARPNFVDVVPYQLILEEDLEIARGNSLLKPTTSDNFDALFEYYFEDVGLVSGGFFYKRLKDYIFPFRFRENRLVGGVTQAFDVLQPRNGESADLYGLEIAFNKRLTFLPKPLDGFGVYANYTRVTSNATLPGLDVGSPSRDSILPGQAKNIGNFAVFYERFGFSGRGSLHYRDRYLSEVAATPSGDLFIGNHLQFDLSASQRITKNVRVFAEVININNRPFISYEGVESRIRQDERYKWWATFGVKLDW